MKIICGYLNFTPLILPLSIKVIASVKYFSSPYLCPKIPYMKDEDVRNHTTSVSGITRLWKSWNKNPCAIYFTSLAESNSLLFSENLQAYKLKVFWDNTCQALSFFILDPKHWRRYLLAVEDLNFSCHLDLISFECIRFKNVKLHGSGGMTTKWGRGEYRLACHSNKYTFSFIRWSDS